MKLMIFTGSPNTDGLTAACGKAAEQAGFATSSKGTTNEAILINLNQINIGNCKSCGNGWGTCRNEHACQVTDDFHAIHETMKTADAFVFVSPVYWGEMSEVMKAFTDRLRRCEAWLKENNLFYEKPVICIAAAGGSGNGTISCLASMERFVMHVSAQKFDFISITQKTRSYKLDTIACSVRTLLESK